MEVPKLLAALLALVESLERDILLDLALLESLHINVDAIYLSLLALALRTGRRCLYRTLIEHSRCTELHLV